MRFETLLSLITFSSITILTVYLADTNADVTRQLALLKERFNQLRELKVDQAESLHTQQFEALKQQDEGAVLFSDS